MTSLFANSQTIVPLPDTELCPNQEYTFTVSNLPGNFSSLNSNGPVTITQSPSGSGTSITFKAKFGDVNGIQGFSISYNGGTYEPKYTKIKSLFGGYSENFSNPTTLSVPICQTTPVALNISGNKYWNTSTNPYTTFGNITTYKYKIPAGWYLNSTLFKVRFETVTVTLRFSLFALSNKPSVSILVMVLRKALVSPKVFFLLANIKSVLR